MKSFNQAEALKNKGNSFMQTGQILEAIQLYREAIKLDPNYISAHSNLGMSLAMSGKMDEAENVYLNALKINPKSYFLLVNIGILYTRTGKFVEAITHLKNYINSSDDDIMSKALANSYLTVAYLEQEEFKKAHTALFTCLELSNEIDPNVLEMLEDVVNEKVNLYNSEPILYYINGMVNIFNDIPDEAIKAFKKAIDLDPKYAEAHFALGICLGIPRNDDFVFDTQTSKRLNKAVKYLTTAIELKPDWAEAHFKLGLISLKILDIEAPFRAHAALKRVIELAKEQNLTNDFVNDSYELLKNNEVLKVLQ